MELCCGDTKQSGFIFKETYIEYSRRNPQTGAYQEKTLEHKTNETDDSYSTWKRMKFRSKDKYKLLKSCQSDSFIDVDFPHSNISIAHEQVEMELEWKRINEIIDDPIFATAQTFDNFAKVLMNRKPLKEALQFMHRTHPHKLKKLMCAEVSFRGIYEFKLYRNGIIQNVIIDDFVPVVKGKFPLEVGPVRQRQVFPMVIEKALAKICGSYEKIPVNVDEILEILFCGPLRKNRVNELSDLHKTVPLIERTVSSEGVAALISKNQPKIRSFGINQNQIYHILNYHKLKNKQSQYVNILQLVSEKKLVAWNGKYSHNDSSWDNIVKEDRLAMFKSLKKNSSFCFVAGDLPRIFDHLIAFEGTETSNKDWIESISENSYPSLSSFELTKRDKVFIRLCTVDKVRNSLILAAVVGEHQYRYITAAFHDNSYAVELSADLQPGTYLLCVHNDWILQSNGTFNGAFNLFISSNSHTAMQKVSDTSHPDFLQTLFTSHSQTLRNTNPMPPYFNWKKYYSICEMSAENGFAYLCIQIKDTKKDKIKIKIDSAKLLSERWEILQPHSDRREINLDKQMNPNVILILKTLKYVSQQKSLRLSGLKTIAMIMPPFDNPHVIHIDRCVQAIQQKQLQELNKINQQLQMRAEKFGSEYTQLTLETYKLFKIQKASETGNILYLENILLEDIADLQERKRRIKQRTEKFFPQVRVQSNPNKFFNERSVPDFTADNTVIRYDTWYLFGVDYMSNERIRNYFHTHPHFRIQWINDSSCNICFNSRQQAEQAIAPHKKSDGMTDEKQQIWYELQQYEVEGVKRKLFCRLSTNRDVKQKEQHGHHSKYYQWQINKQKISSFVKRKAKQEIYKTKNIKRQNTKRVVKKNQESSSSDVNSSDSESQKEHMKDE